LVKKPSSRSTELPLQLCAHISSAARARRANRSRRAQVNNDLARRFSEASAGQPELRTPSAVCPVWVFFSVIDLPQAAPF
jgi:hypothetical protein